MIHAALITALTLAAPASADPFCDGLREIAAAAPGRFASLESGKDDVGRVGLGFEWNKGECRITNGATAIAYDERQKPTAIYACQEGFYPVETPLTDGRLREIGMRAAACFGVAMVRDGNRWNESPLPAYLVVVPGARIHVGAFEMPENEGPIRHVYPSGTDTRRFPAPRILGDAVMLQVSQAY